jgi:hypothetical protein
MATTITHFKGNRSPSLADTIRIDGTPFDLTGSSVKFKMRAEGSSTLKVDSAATIVSPTAGTVRYDWASADVDTGGEFFGWWEVTLPSAKTQDTREFLVTMLDHAPIATDALTTIQAARSYVGDPNADQNLITVLINSASRSIRQYTSRQFLPAETAVAKKFRYDGAGILDLPFTELRTVTSIVAYTDLPSADQVTLTPASGTTEADWRLEPRQGTSEGTYLWLILPTTLPWKQDSTSAYPPRWDKGIELTITGNWGAATVPGDVEEACLMAVANRYRNPEGVTSRTLGALSISDIPDAPNFSSSLPRAARYILNPYRRVVHP